MDLTKGIYVSSMRALAAVAGPLGLLRYLAGKRQSRACLYIRSLFSIYNAQDLAELDLPWWTFRAIDYVDEILRDHGSQMTAFEYGTGASTLWLARRCRAVYSVEHDPNWADQARLLCAQQENVRIADVPATPVVATTRCQSKRSGWRGLSFDNYVESIRTYAFDFDLIVIDGRCRVECLAEAKRKLKRGGLIIFDDSNRARYHNAIDGAALRRKVFRGLVPGLPFPGETTILLPADARTD